MTEAKITTVVHETLADALAAAQAEFPPVPKTRTATIPGKDGKPGYSYKYADLGDIFTAVRPVLAKHGLAFSQHVGSDGGMVAVKSLLKHKGETLESDYLQMPAGNTPQTYGSALTYAKRYSGSALLGIAAEEDDDGAAATHSADAGRTYGSSETPRTKSPGEACSNKQIAKLVMSAKDKGYTEADLIITAKKRYGVIDSLGELSKGDASAFIDAIAALEPKGSGGKGLDASPAEPAIEDEFDTEEIPFRARFHRYESGGWWA